MTEGCYTDTETILGVLLRAHEVAGGRMNMKTFCHKRLGDTELYPRLCAGRVIVRRYPVILKRLHQIISETVSDNSAKEVGQ